ncbi:transporter substrate-binding domain-containing protein [Castellaniella caeni]|uniref:transporter substrate-binding domain-containing protein n=1 Tax=Castellaniella caeni TaxID=266123 RepID=UPI0008347397|nr:transporter substrate-binding domain-containing protein [Castellaniella caeni]
MKLHSLILNGALLAAALSVTAPAVQAQDLLDKVKASGTLVVGLEGTYPPFGYRDSAGKLTGFDVDVITAVAHQLGAKPQFVTTEWSGIIAGLQAGKFDVIANQVSITPDREKALDFSVPYIYSAAQVIQRKDDQTDYSSPAAFKDKKVAVVLGSNYVPMVKAIPGAIVKTYPGAVEFLSDLAGGRLDAGVNDRLLLPYLIRQSNLPLRQGALLPGESTKMGIPFRKGNPAFAKAIDAAFQTMRSDGTLKTLSKKWFGADVTEAPQP